MKLLKISAGAYQFGPYRINLVRPGYWDVWLGDEQMSIDGWSGWPTMRAACLAAERLAKATEGTVENAKDPKG